MAGNDVRAVMDGYIRDVRKSLRHEAFGRDGFIDSDYPHSNYDYSTDDHNNCEYRQYACGGWN